MQNQNGYPEKGDVSSVSKLPHSGKILRIILLAFIAILFIVLAWESLGLF